MISKTSFDEGIDDKKENSTSLTNSTNNEMIKNSIALFSASTFYVIIGCILSICTLSFFLLNYLDLVKNEKKFKIEKDENLENKQTLLENDRNKTIREININSKLTLTKKIIMFKINFLTTFVLYGILPGLASYSTLPYGY
jgi:uncharacterized ion transporter superfamily protein YfcC